MAVTEQLSPEPIPHSNRLLTGAVLLLAAATVGLLLTFAGYYYWDRYVGRLGDQSPLEQEISRLEAAIHDNPQDPALRLSLAEFYLAQGLNHDAAAQAGQILAHDPANEGALLIQGMSFFRLNQPQAALDPLEKFVAMRRSQSLAHADTALEAAYYFLGVSYLQLERPKLAIPLLEEALLINRADADALYQLGQAYAATGQPQRALEQYHQAIRLVPDFTEVYAGMIEAYSALSQPGQVAYARGMQAFSQRDFATARTELEAAVAARPDFIPAQLGLGLTLEKQGEFAAALTIAQRVIELEPDNFAAQQLFRRAEITLKQRPPQEAQ
ncbi:MAG: hypothetical protein Kow0031_18080 [Anaerolineae bacterium]